LRLITSFSLLASLAHASPSALSSLPPMLSPQFHQEKSSQRFGATARAIGATWAPMIAQKMSGYSNLAADFCPPTAPAGWQFPALSDFCGDSTAGLSWPTSFRPGSLLKAGNREHP